MSLYNLIKPKETRSLYAVREIGDESILYISDLDSCREYIINNPDKMLTYRPYILE